MKFMPPTPEDAPLFFLVGTNVPEDFDRIQRAIKARWRFLELIGYVGMPHFVGILGLGTLIFTAASPSERLADLIFGLIFTALWFHPTWWRWRQKRQFLQSIQTHPHSAFVVSTHGFSIIPADETDRVPAHITPTLSAKWGGLDGVSIEPDRIFLFFERNRAMLIGPHLAAGDTDFECAKTQLRALLFPETLALKPPIPNP